MMKLLLLACMLFSFTSCAAIRQMAKEEAEQLWREDIKPEIENRVTAAIVEKAPELMQVLDTNKDKTVQLEEIRGLNLKDPQLWLIIVTVLGNLLGWKRLTTITDELYDRTAGTAPPAK